MGLKKEVKISRLGNWVRLGRANSMESFQVYCTFRLSSSWVRSSRVGGLIRFYGQQDQVGYWITIGLGGNQIGLISDSYYWIGSTFRFSGSNGMILG